MFSIVRAVKSCEAIYCEGAIFVANSKHWPRRVLSWIKFCLVKLAVGAAATLHLIILSVKGLESA